MKRTLKEIYELIQQKKQNALNDLNGYAPKTPAEFMKLRGEIDAYTDVLILIETSKVLENEKV